MPNRTAALRAMAEASDSAPFAEFSLKGAAIVFSLPLRSRGARVRRPSRPASAEPSDDASRGPLPIRSVVKKPLLHWVLPIRGRRCQAARRKNAACTRTSGAGGASSARAQALHRLCRGTRKYCGPAGEPGCRWRPPRGGPWRGLDRVGAVDDGWDPQEKIASGSIECDRKSRMGVLNRIQ